MGFRDRLLTPAGARAVTSPGAILAAGLVAAGGIAAGIALPVAGVLGVAAYVGAAIAQLPKGPQRPEIRPQTLRQPWRGFVEEALDARNRFDRAVASARPGPLRSRLGEIADRVAQGIDESWRIAQHGQALEDALKQLEPLSEVEKRLQTVEAELAGERPADDRLRRTADALQSQMASTRRIAEVARETRDRLRLLDARLDESVARAVELSLRAGDVAEIGGLDDDVESIVTEMETLRVALEETAATA
jgi:hypothetical protein